MTPERTAYLRQIATNTTAHGKTWTGPLGEVLMQAADAIRELSAEADELAALRIEHTAWGALLDVTRRDRDEARAFRPAAESCHRLANYMSTHRDLLEYDGCDMAGDGAIRVLGAMAEERDALRAQVVELTRLGASIHKAAAAARKAERADVVAWLHTDGPALAFASCLGGSEYTCAAKDIERGAHEGAAEVKRA